jgi:hypothetical protein
MHYSADLSFERIVDEFARWRAVPEHDRSAAPSWWWGPAFEARGLSQPMPAQWCSKLGLPEGSPVSGGVDVLLGALDGQTLLPWTGDFPFNARHLIETNAD